jgi:hypothetical protein
MPGIHARNVIESDEGFRIASGSAPPLLNRALRISSSLFVK